MSKISPVTFKDFEFLLFYAQSNHAERDEPIPAMSSDNAEKVKSCLETPFQTFDGEYLYKGFLEKAAVLFYLLTKNHPLMNGNKRMAILTLHFFYFLNGFYLQLSHNDMLELARQTANSDNPDRAKKYIRRQLLNRRINLSEVKKQDKVRISFTLIPLLYYSIALHPLPA